MIVSPLISTVPGFFYLEGWLAFLAAVAGEDLFDMFLFGGEEHSTAWVNV